MDGGQVAAEGTHVSLLDRYPLYISKRLSDAAAFSKAHDSNADDYRLERDRRKWYRVLIIIFEGGVY